MIELLRHLPALVAALPWLMLGPFYPTPRTGALPPSAEPQVYRAVPAGSHLAIRTGRAGLFGFLGHEHGVLATAWSMYLCMDPAQLEAGSISVMVRADSLVIDSPAALETVGLDPHGGPDEETVAKLQRKLMGPDVLDSRRYPTIRFDSETVRVSGGGKAEAVVEGRLQLRGRAQRIEVPLEVERLADTVRLTGRATIRQTSYGIKPESVAGVVKVADEMDLRVRLTTVPTGESCPGRALH